MKQAVALIFLCLSVFCEAQIYKNYSEAGRSAFRDKNFALAGYFFDCAIREVPKDSIVDIWELHAFRRNSARFAKDYDVALAHAAKSIEALHTMGMQGSYFVMEDSLEISEIYALKNDSCQANAIAEEVFGRALKADLSWGEKLALSDQLGKICSRSKNWYGAESAYELGAAIVRKMKLSAKTPWSLNLYGNALYQNGKYSEALEVYKEQRKHCLDLYGSDSREFQWANYCIANILAFMGRIDEGGELYREVIAWYRNKILNDLQTIPSNQRETYLGNMIDILQDAIPFGVAANYNEDEFTRTSYENLLLSKGLLLATEKSTETIIREKGTQKEKRSLETLKALKTKLNDLLADHNSDSKDVLDTYFKIKTIDFELANACAGYGNNTAFSSIGYETVKNCLKDDEVLLDFADYKPKSKPRQYICYEIRRSQKYPKVHYICNGAQIDSLLALEKNLWSNLYNGEAGEDMAKIIGLPLKEIIGDAETVYYVPSGIFHKLAVEAIPDGDEMLGERHIFRRLSSAREVVSESDGTPQGGKAQLYGGLTYGSDIKGLPRSLEEVNDISSVISGNMDSFVLKGEDGTTESFMALSDDSPEIIHLSTHGFYYTPEDKDLPASLQGYDDAMSLSGLVMSGGSLATRQGLLTADEVSRSNLSGTSIACLASCHSGQGEVTSEGIYGLQRAFKKAGVKSVVMNLWEASDVATKFFMTRFYTDLINGSKDRHKAFQFAKEETRKKYPSPYYWAGFVMID